MRVAGYKTLRGWEMHGKLAALIQAGLNSILVRCKRIRLSRAMALRMVADIVVVNGALAAAMALRYLSTMAVGGEAAAVAAWRDFAGAFLRSSPIITVISIAVYYACGLYTHGRRYRGRYKLLVVAQAVSLSYLLFGVALLLAREFIPFPRSVLAGGWLLTLAGVMAARLWRQAWAAFWAVERRLLSAVHEGDGLQNVLVIGGAGYIGSALTARLLARGYRVRVLDLLLYGDDPIRQFYGNPRFELVHGDFRHIDCVVNAAKDMHAIVHLGAIVGDSACKLSEDLTLEINQRATRTIAEVGKGYGVRRFIFASTCSVYGASDELLDERSALRPISLYARTKVVSERVLLSLADATFAPIILRFGTVYGLSGRPRFDLVVNLLAAKAVQEGEVGIVGGSQWRPFIHVQDVAETIVRMLEAPKAVVCNQIFNVGSNEQNYQIEELGRLIKEMMPAARVVTQAQEDNRNYRVRFDRLRQAVNFDCRYTVRDGIREIVEAFVSGRIADYKDPHYNNYAFLSQHSELRQALVNDGLVRESMPLLDPEEAGLAEPRQPLMPVSAEASGGLAMAA